MPLIEKSSGIQMQINDRPETLAHAKAMGWKFVDEKPKAETERKKPGPKPKAETE